MLLCLYCSLVRVCVFTCMDLHMQVRDIQFLYVCERQRGIVGIGSVCIAARCEEECDMSECSGCSCRPAPLILFSNCPLSPSHASVSQKLISLPPALTFYLHLCLPCLSDVNVSLFAFFKCSRLLLSLCKSLAIHRAVFILEQYV